MYSWTAKTPKEAIVLIKIFKKEISKKNIQFLFFKRVLEL